MRMKNISGILALFILAAFHLAGCTKNSGGATQRLFNAIAASDTAAMRQAIADGARLNALDEYARTPLDVVLSKEEAPQLAPLLVKAGAFVPADILATGAYACRTPELITLLLNAGADINAITFMEKDALMTAAADGNLEAIRFLLDKGLDVNACDVSGSTPLIYAAGNGRQDAVRALLAAGADMGATNRWGHTAFVAAVRPGGKEGRLATASVLLDAGSDVNARDWEGKTALFGAARGDAPELVTFLLTAGADVGATDNNGVTALMYAAYCDAPLAVLQLLLDAGADANARDAEGATPLMHLAWGQGGRHDGAQKVELLLRAGADINAQTYPAARPKRRGWTALMYAAIQNNGGTIYKDLITAGADASLKDADGRTAANHTATLHLFLNRLPDYSAALSQSADVNGFDRNDTTPLHAAVRGEDPARVDFLLRHGADANDYGKRFPPLYAAAGLTVRGAPGKSGHLFKRGAEWVEHRSASSRFKKTQLDIMHLLLIAGADPDGRHADGVRVKPPLTAHNLSLQAFDLLIAAGADINQPAADAGGNGPTPLMAALQSMWNEPSTREKQALVSKMLAAGADANARNSAGDNALMYAAFYSGNPAVFKHLLDAGADVNAVNQKGMTALMLAACSTKNPDVIFKLLNAGADKAAKDNRGKTALDFLKQNRHLQSTRYFSKLLKALE